MLPAGIKVYLRGYVVSVSDDHEGRRRLPHPENFVPSFLAKVEQGLVAREVLGWRLKRRCNEFDHLVFVHPSCTFSHLCLKT